MRTLAALLFLSSAWLSAAEPQILERYNFHFGATADPGRSSGAELRFHDRYLGNGTADAHITLTAQSSSSTLFNRPLLLSLKVQRQVQPDEVVFALLMFKVEIRGFDSQGTQIFSRDLPGFTFGDSASGLWYERIPNLPTALAQLTVTFHGNYE
jgi:hypothetical protein